MRGAQARSQEKKEKTVLFWAGWSQNPNSIYCPTIELGFEVSTIEEGTAIGAGKGGQNHSPSR
jgi:hypothetical protein